MLKFLMNSFPGKPSESNYENWEIFNHKNYTEANEIRQKEIRRLTSLASYEIEKSSKHSWLKKYFFPYIKPEEFENKVVLDLGCFTAGRVISWAEEFRFGKCYGIDINPIFKIAGEEFAKEKNIDAEFFTSQNEDLPFENNSIDILISTDTFEHVNDLNKSMQECYRVLKPGGKLLALFPQYLQPFESHLNFVTKLPFLHWFFSSKKLTEVYFQILEDRGKDAYWYKSKKNYLEKWERLPTINGTSIRMFESILNNEPWKVQWIKRPIFYDGRKADLLIFKLLKTLIYPLVFIKYLDEFFMGRICVICKK